MVRTDDSEADGGGSVLSGLGLRSTLSLRLRADRRRLTVLTAYARKPQAFDEDATRIGRLFTAHVSSPWTRRPCASSSPRRCAPGT